VFEVPSSKLEQLPAGEQLLSRRQTAWELLGSMAMPTAAEEIWRYSRIDELDPRGYQPVLDPPRIAGTGEQTELNMAGGTEPFLAYPEASEWLKAQMGAHGAWLGIQPWSAVAVTVDGWPILLPRASSLPRGLRVSSLSRDPGGFSPSGDEGLGDLDYFGVLNEALSPDPVVVGTVALRRTSQDTAVRADNGPVSVLVVHLSSRSLRVPAHAPSAPAGRSPSDSRVAFPTDSPRRPLGVVCPRVTIEAGEDTSLQVVELFLGRYGLLAPVTLARLAPRASLGYLALHATQADWEIAYQDSKAAQESSLVSMTSVLSGTFSRVRTDCSLEGEFASSKLLALYGAAGSDMVDLRTLQRHCAPHTVSDLLYVGAVAEQSQAVYSGLIRVEKGARKADALQTNRNLVLSSGARADSVPNLEIEENDVRCSHASALGPMDPDQLWYLQTRGVPPWRAQRLIIEGFYETASRECPVGGASGLLREALVTRVSGSSENEAAKEEAS